jgi:transposase
MDLKLEDDEVVELRRLLTEALSDLGSEIADTDNANFRRTLRARRELLKGVRDKLVSAR